MDKLLCAYPQAQFKTYKDDILAAVSRVLDKGPYILGEEVESFEKEFAAYHDIDYSVGVGSGTDALILSLKALDIGDGDEVITVSHTALATAAAIVWAGATPVLVDIEKYFYTMDPSKIEEAITPRTKAIIPVHIYGQPCDMDAILAIARKRHLKVIEDCAQAHGALYKGQKVGTMGDVGCFSFYPTKNLGAIGDGGGIVTRDAHVATRVKRMRQYGWDDQRVSQEIGCVSRLDPLQAVILRIKLRHLDRDNDRRRTVAEAYNDLLKTSGFTLPKVRDNCEHVYHLYVIQCDNRDDLKKDFMTKGIECGIHYTHPVHDHPGYQGRIHIGPSGLKETNSCIQKILSLPMYPEVNILQLKEKLD